MVLNKMSQGLQRGTGILSIPYHTKKYLRKSERQKDIRRIDMVKRQICSVRAHMIKLEEMNVNYREGHGSSICGRSN